MKNALRYTTGLALALTLFGPAQAEVWRDADTTAAKGLSAAPLQTQVPFLRSARKLKLNTSELSFKLNKAPLMDAGSTGTQIDLPLPNGGTATFLVYNSPIMDGALSAKNPSIQTFSAVDVSNPYNRGRLDMTPSGFHAMFTHNDQTVFVDPLGMNGEYQSYYKSSFANEAHNDARPKFICTAHEYNEKHAGLKTSHAAKAERTVARRDDVSFGTDLRTYRLAVAATGEYTAFHGGTKEQALAAIVTGINRLNDIFERDLAINFELVSNNIDVIYTDGATDPYTDDDPNALLDEATADLNAKIGAENFDMGHVFSTAAGGLAVLGAVCGPFKAEGATGRPDPINDPFLIDLVAHEFGHQLDSNHSFNGSDGACRGNRAALEAYEVGSGSTIMGYAGICDSENIINNSTEYFHTNSISEISEFLANTREGGSCGTVTSLSNATPTADAGADSVIPVSTPFILTGASSDSDAGDTLSHIWEQYDVGVSSTGDRTQRDLFSNPLFRSFVPTASKSRTLPQISDVLSGTTTYGEFLPTRNRDMEFRFTVRDGNGGVASDTRTIDVSDDAGPFTVDDLSTSSLTGNASQTIAWDVANTTAAPISCANVDINFSADGGQSFDTVVLAGTPNDGSQNVTVPNVDTTTGRFQVMCASQPFFAVNGQNLTVAASDNPPPPAENAVPVANVDSFTVDQDSGSTSFAVLNNDTDSDGDTLSLTGVSGFSAGGSASLGGAAIVYTPASGFSGIETFTYEVSDGNGGTSSALVTVTVIAPTPVNVAPSAVDDSFTVDEDDPATLLSVLSNDTDPDGDALSITAVSAPTGGGSAVVSGTDINYQPAAGFSGNETFTYTVGDGNDGSDTATVTVTVTAAPPPPPPVVVTPPPTTTSSGGGGSAGLFLLMLLALGGMMKNARLTRAVTSVKE